MLSFKPLDKESARNIVKLALTECKSADIEYLKMALRSFASLFDEGIKCAVALAHGTLLIRVSDVGKYLFIYPISLSDGADEKAALLALRDYAVKEEIPFLISDIPLDCIGNIEELFVHTSLYIQDKKNVTYCACAFNELWLLPEIPMLAGEKIELSPLDKNDTDLYAALCRDKNVNKYWHYDYVSDVGENVPDDYFLNEALEEYERCVALTVAVRLGGELIGDAVFHSFDFQEHADIGFRLMEKYQGQGLGRDLISTIILYAKKIGLKGLKARVMEDNIRSLKLLRSVMKEIEVKDGIHIFEIEI